MYAYTLVCLHAGAHQTIRTLQGSDLTQAQALTHAQAYTYLVCCQAALFSSLRLRMYASIYACIQVRGSQQRPRGGVYMHMYTCDINRIVYVRMHMTYHTGTLSCSAAPEAARGGGGGGEEGAATDGVRGV